MKKTIACLLVCLLILPAFALADGGFSDDPDAIELAAKSVLMLEVYDDDSELIATGSGFVAFNNRTIVTNYHVIEGAQWMLANSDDGYEYMVTKVLVADEEKDIAICGFMSPTDLTPLEFGDSTDLKRAEAIVAIGSPIGITNSVSLGNISAIYEDDGVSWIQFTAPISEGSSGGVLFDDKGYVIGVTSASYIDTQNLNLAVNIAEVSALYDGWDGEEHDLRDYADLSATPTPAPTATPKPTATPAPTSKYVTLERGDEGETVTRLQEKLAEYGYYNDEINGFFGSSTQRAVKEFNLQNFSSENGYADEKMQELLFEGKPEAWSATPTPKPMETPKPTQRVTLTPTPKPEYLTKYRELKKGDEGDDVKRLQEKLIELSYLDGTAGGIFGSQTQKAVVEFNRTNGLTNGLPIYSGVATQRMQYLLFEGQPKAYTDPEMALSFPNNAYAEWNYPGGDKLKIHFQVKNTAKVRTVKAFELYVYAEDVWGNDLYDDYVYYDTTTRTVKPGDTVYSDYMTIPDADDISTVYCAIHKVAYTDGTTYTVQESKMHYVSWTIS